MKKQYVSRACILHFLYTPPLSSHDKKVRGLRLKGFIVGMKKIWAFAALLSVMAAAAAAHADGGADELSRLLGKGDSHTTVSAAQTTDGSIRITPDKTHIVRLDRNAASVIVANPAHAEIVLDTPRLLVIMPRSPGATSFTVLDAEGEVIMEKNVIVAAAAQPSYVRIRRVCLSQDTNCRPTTYHYCPDGCYDINPVAAATGGSTPAVMGAPAAQDAPQDAQQQPVEQQAPGAPAPPAAPQDDDAPADDGGPR